MHRSCTIPACEFVELLEYNWCSDEHTADVGFQTNSLLKESITITTFITLSEKNTWKTKIVTVALIIYHLFSASCFTIKGQNLSPLTSKMEAWWEHLFVYTYLSFNKRQSIICLAYFYNNKAAFYITGIWIINTSEWGSLFSYQSCLQNHHYSVYSWQFEPDLSFDGWYRHVCHCHHCKKHKTYLQNCYRISRSDKLFTYTVFIHYFSLLSIL